MSSLAVAAGKTKDSVRDWIEAHLERSVQVEAAAHCNEEGLLFNGVAIQGIDEDSRLNFVEGAGEPVASILIPKHSLEARAEGNSMVLHLEVSGLHVHIWDSARVVADLERRGLVPVDSSSGS